MTRIDMAVAIACISILLSSAYAAPPIIPKARASHVSIRGTSGDSSEVLEPEVLSLPVNCPVSPLPIVVGGDRQYKLMCNGINGETSPLTNAFITWDAAKSVCDALDFGGTTKWTLAKITSDTQLAAVASLVNDPTVLPLTHSGEIGARAWLGINDKTFQGEYVYEDGSICGGKSSGGGTTTGYCGPVSPALEILPTTARNKPWANDGSGGLLGSVWTNNQPRAIAGQDCIFMFHNLFGDHYCNALHTQLYVCSACAPGFVEDPNDPTSCICGDGLQPTIIEGPTCESIPTPDSGIE